MSYLVRKIAPAKWSDARSLETLPSDALTSDLGTSQNTLSLWEIGSKDEINNAILALAISKNTKKIEKMDLILIPMEIMRTSNLPVRESPGDTFAEKLSNTHREVVDLKYSSLGVFAQIIIELLPHNNSHVTITKANVESIVKTAYKNKIFDISCLPEEMQRIIKK